MNKKRNQFPNTVAYLLKRLRGISTPVGGISWDSGDSEPEVARRVVAFLEDRRALTRPFAPLTEGNLLGTTQSCEHCVASVYKIREYLTNEIGKLKDRTELKEHLRAIRRACRFFLEAVGPQPLMPVSPKFYPELAKLRDITGGHLLWIIERFDVDIEEDIQHFLGGDLTGMLPDEDDATPP